MSAFFQAQRLHIIALAARFHIPTIYDLREFADAGGLISYGINEPDIRRQLGIYTAKILRGLKPSDLPVFQPTKFPIGDQSKNCEGTWYRNSVSMQLTCRRGHRVVRQASWRGPAGGSPARVRRSGRPVVSVAWSSVTAAAKRTQQSRGVGY